MKNKINLNGIEIEYEDSLLKKIKETYGFTGDVSKEDILKFFQDSLRTAINKGYGLVDESDKLS